MSGKKVSVPDGPFKDGKREKKRRLCTRGHPVAACQRYLHFASRTFPTPLLRSPFSPEAAHPPQEDAHPCLFRVMYIERLATIIAADALSHGANYKDTKAAFKIIAIYFLTCFSLLLAASLQISFTRSHSPRYQTRAAAFGRRWSQRLLLKQSVT